MSATPLMFEFDAPRSRVASRLVGEVSSRQGERSFRTPPSRMSSTFRPSDRFPVVGTLACALRAESERPPEAPSASAPGKTVTGARTSPHTPRVEQIRATTRCTPAGKAARTAGRPIESVAEGIDASVPQASSFATWNDAERSAPSTQTRRLAWSIGSSGSPREKRKTTTGRSAGTPVPGVGWASAIVGERYAPGGAVGVTGGGVVACAVARITGAARTIVRRAMRSAPGAGRNEVDHVTGTSTSCTRASDDRRPTIARAPTVKAPPLVQRQADSETRPPARSPLRDGAGGYEGIATPLGGVSIATTAASTTQGRPVQPRAPDRSGSRASDLPERGKRARSADALP